MNRTCGLTSALLVAFASQAAIGELITMNFTGVVTRIDDDDLVLPSSIRVGLPVTGYYVYESATLDSISNPELALYKMPVPPTGMSMTIGGFTFRSKPGPDNFGFNLVNDWWFGNDWYAAKVAVCSTPPCNEPGPDGLRVDSLGFILEDPSKTALATDRLPVPCLDDFPIKESVLVGGCVTPGSNGFCGGPGVVGFFSIWGEILSLTPSVSRCGNMVRDGCEECDDGGESEDCDADCTLVDCGDGTLNVTAGEHCDGLNAPACPGECQSDCTCPSGGVCSPDADEDGIQDSLDRDPAFSHSFRDSSTVPETNGTIEDRGDQELCVSDLPGSEGVRIESLGGGPSPASIAIFCPGEPIQILTLHSGESADVSCGSVTTQAVIGNVDLALLNNSIKVATLVLLQGNSITYQPVTLEVTAPTANSHTLTLVSKSGEQQTLAPGQTVTLLLSWKIPAAVVWLLSGVVLVLLVAAKLLLGRGKPGPFGGAN